MGCDGFKDKFDETKDKFDVLDELKYDSDYLENKFDELV